MDRLYPCAQQDIDAYGAYRPADPRSPLVRLNMVSTLDGRITGADGISGDLGGDGDREAFFAMRNMADAVVAGAGTVRAEGYGPMRVRESLAEQRTADGLEGPAPIVVVTRSLDLDLDAPLFADATAPTIVVTTADAPADRIADIRAAGGLIVGTGRGEVDLAAAIGALAAEHGLRHLLVEGGPALNGHLLAAGLAHELCVTLAPILAGGADERRLVDGLAQRHDLTLSKVLKHGSELLLTYRRG